MKKPHSQRFFKTLPPEERSEPYLRATISRRSISPEEERNEETHLHMYVDLEDGDTSYEYQFSCRSKYSGTIKRVLKLVIIFGLLFTILHLIFDKQFNFKRKQWYSCVVKGDECVSTPLPEGQEPTLILWQTMGKVEVEPNMLQKHNAKFLPENSEIRWVDDAMAAAMVRDVALEMMELGILAKNFCVSYLNIRPGAFRADVWRAVALWKYGGLYLDHKVMFAVDIDDFIDLDKPQHAMCPTDDPGQVDTALWNAVAYASEPYLPFYECVLKKVITNISVDTLEYGTKQKRRHVLSLTGPEAWYNGMEDHDEGKCGSAHSVDTELIHRHPTGDVKFFGFQTDDVVEDVDERVVLFGHQKAHNKGHKGTLTYGELWTKKLVLCEKPMSHQYKVYGQKKSIQYDPCFTPGPPTGQAHRVGSFQRKKRIEEFCQTYADLHGEYADENDYYDHEN